jgi:hypothetical protein
VGGFEEMSEIIRIIRIIEYTGPREAVEKQVNESLHGVKTIEKTGVKITATTLGNFAEIIEKSK